MDDTQRLDKLERWKGKFQIGVDESYTQSGQAVWFFTGEYGMSCLTPVPWDDEHFGKYSPEELADIPKTLREAIDKLPNI